MAGGYVKLAAFMTEDHYPIFKKYQSLATNDLLLLQAELSYLEYQYNEIVKSDGSEKDERQYHNRDWLLMQTAQNRGLEGEQWVTAIAIRAKLREYYAAISQYSTIASIRQPKESERALIHEWISSPALGGGCGFLGRDLGGFEQKSVYDAIHHQDLAILGDSHGEDDLFTRFITGPVLRCFHSICWRSRTPPAVDEEQPHIGDKQSALHRYDDRHIAAATNILATVFSSLAPLMSIVILSFVENDRARLGLVCLFTVLFCLSLALATKARRIEIFAATVAFASVQVVFIGTTSSDS